RSAALQGCSTARTGHGSTRFNTAVLTPCRMPAARAVVVAQPFMAARQRVVRDGPRFNTVQHGNLMVARLVHERPQSRLRKPVKTAVRGGAPVACGPLEASHSARACIRGNEAIKQKKRLDV
ncbi:MAG TPA: hypothetical protein VNJ04_20735, partial [Gemmatimonadaceae bacterium]|nr:hypothetical protein [Gemmatimonadaceae bacterium]